MAQSTDPIIKTVPFQQIVSVWSQRRQRVVLSEGHVPYLNVHLTDGDSIGISGNADPAGLFSVYKCARSQGLYCAETAA